MKQFDWTDIPQDLRESMEGSLDSLYQTLENLEKINPADMTALELSGHGRAQIKKMIASTETNIQNTINIFQKK